MHVLFSILARWVFLLRLSVGFSAAPFLLVLVLLVSALVSANMQADAAESTETQPMRLLDQQPFDRITLNAASGNEKIDTLLLDLPHRKVPSSLPTEGSLELRRLSQPSVLYTVPWNSIARIELYEQLLLAEAIQLASVRDLAQSYDYFNFLHKNYPKLAGLNDATEKYLRQDALASYAKKNYEETLTILLALYDLNPQHRTLQKFVETVTDRLIARHLSKRDFASARSVLELLSDGFPDLRLTNITTWRNKFEAGAAKQLAAARKAIDQQQFLKARRSLRRALAILPAAAGANEMLKEIDRKSPQIVVGVDQLVVSPRNTLDWSAARVSQLTEPKLLSLNGFGAEGGNYHSDWVDITSDDTGLQLDLELNAAARREGISTEIIALELLRQADPAQVQYRADFADLLSHVEIRQGNRVSIHWQRSHVRPEALLPLALHRVTHSTNPPGVYQSTFDRGNKKFVAYQLSKSNKRARGPEAILENFYSNEDTAFADLLSGELDLLARVPPWQVARLQQSDQVVVSPYRLPSIHVLLLNYKKPLMRRREFRRALCYGIDRSQILNDILLGGERRPGFRVLSAPLPAGITLTDPVGYAYNQGLQPRSYEPRLSAVLSAVARNSLAKLAAAKVGTSLKEEGRVPGEDASEEDASEEDHLAVTVKPLVLAHSPDPVATIVCQTMKLQLDAIGIPIKLKTLAAQEADDDDYDLRYAQLAIWEPLVDARRLLGPHGLAGHCSASMSLALQDVDQAKNWKEARTRLQEVHQIALNDLAVIPLWQTVDFFAHRKNLQGVGSAPVTLYQNVVDWKRAGQTSRRGGRR